MNRKKMKAKIDHEQNLSKESTNLVLIIPDTNMLRYQKQNKWNRKRKKEGQNKSWTISKISNINCSSFISDTNTSRGQKKTKTKKNGKWKVS